MSNSNSGSGARVSVDDLLPVERESLMVCITRWRRGDDPLPSTSTMCMLALARLTGLCDWTERGHVEEAQS